MFFFFPPACDRHGQHHVFQQGQVGNQLEGLEDKSQVFTAKISPLFRCEPVQIQGVHHHLPPAGTIHGPHHRQQGGFSGTGLPGDGDELPVVNVKIHTIQGCDPVIACGICFAEVMYFNEVVCHSFFPLPKGVVKGFSGHRWDPCVRPSQPGKGWPEGLRPKP